MTEQQSSGYDVGQLQVLEGLDAVRKRPEMYIGPTDARGLQHLVWEVVDNAVDEALAGHADRITVTLHDDGSVAVTDNGRGIPTGTDQGTGLPGPVLVFTKLHAGGKFGGDGSGYKVSGGLHGVGASVVNALSERTDVTVRRDGRRHLVSFRRGQPGVFGDDGSFTDDPALQEDGKASDTGTDVRFWPELELFDPGASLDLEQIHERARQTAFLVPGLEIVVTDERGEQPSTETFRFDGGTADYVELLSAGEEVSPVIRVRGEHTYTERARVQEDGQLVTREVTRQMDVDVAMRWTSQYEPTVKSYVNVVATPGGGSHVAGFERALTRTLNKAIDEQGLWKKNDESCRKEDIQEGLVAVVTVRIEEPRFEGQTKSVLGTAAATDAVRELTNAQLGEWLAAAANKQESRRVLMKVLGAMRARMAARQKREETRRKQALETSTLPSKLADCSLTDVERTELFILEGDSAMGTAKAARDSRYQALLPIRGKILNTLKEPTHRFLKNKECGEIVTALGAGTGEDFALDASRYGRVIVLADADVDGAHIRTLLLTLFYVYMYPLIADGRVFAAEPPLYGIRTTGKHPELRYAHTEEERDAVIAEMTAQGKSLRPVQRYKGLGEMDANQLAETAMDPASRQLRRVTIREADRAAEAFDTLMGEDPAKRWEFITRRAAEVDREALDV